VTAAPTRVKLRIGPTSNTIKESPSGRVVGTREGIGRGERATLSGANI
jgi:hypothetical protein